MDAEVNHRSPFALTAAPPEQLDDLCALACEVLGAASVAVVLRDEAGQQRLAFAGKTPESVPAALWEETLASRLPQAQLESGVSPLQRVGDQSVCALTAPVSGGEGSGLGVLQAVLEPPRPFTSGHYTIVELLARNVSTQLALRHSRTQLARAAELYALTTETAQDYIFVKDRECRIVQANATFLTLYPPEQRTRVIGYTTVEHYEPEEAEAFLENDRLALTKGRSETVEQINFPDGKRRILHTVKQRFEDHQGEPYIVGVARDVTEREELISQLEDANNHLQDFASTASHDLKAPLRAVRQLLNLLQEEAGATLSDDANRFVAMARARLDQMTELVDDLLSYARVGREQLAFESIALRVLLDECLLLLDVPASFEIQCDKTTVRLPRIPLRLVLTNLVGNAIKHHDRASGRVTITVEERADATVLRVRDDGPGITTAYRDRVFRRFERLSSRHAGSGLGLPLVRKAVQAYGGSATIVGPEGRGTQVEVVWPKAPEPPPAISLASVAGALTPITSRRRHAGPARGGSRGTRLRPA